MWYGGEYSGSKYYHDLMIVQHYSEKFQYYHSFKYIRENLVEMPYGYSKDRLAAMIRQYLLFGEIEWTE